MRRLNKYTIVYASALFLLMAFSASSGFCEVRATYLYHLSDFTGTVPYQVPKIRVDNFNREIYVATVTGNGVKVFNDFGMQIYEFKQDKNLLDNVLNDFSIDEAGWVFVLSALRDTKTGIKSYTVQRCNYMLIPVETVELHGFPSELGGFNPSRLIYHQGLLYLGDMLGMQIAVVDRQGRYQKHYDLKPLLSETKDREDYEMGDFFVDRDGSILFTAPVIGSAYRVSPDGNASLIAKRGSRPGTFGIPSGIVVDAKGNYLVSDKLKSVVLVFDRDLRFLTQFGYRGPNEFNTIAPTYLAVDDRNRVYISQLANRGVSVFELSEISRN
jgi:hypothetical protein